MLDINIKPSPAEFRLNNQFLTPHGNSMFPTSVVVVRDSRMNRSHVLRVIRKGTTSITRTYQMSWRRFKRLVLRDFGINLSFPLSSI